MHLLIFCLYFTFFPIKSYYCNFTNHLGVKQVGLFNETQVTKRWLFQLIHFDSDTEIRAFMSACKGYNM